MNHKIWNVTQERFVCKCLCLTPPLKQALCYLCARARHAPLEFPFCLPTQTFGHITQPFMFKPDSTAALTVITWGSAASRQSTLLCWEEVCTAVMLGHLFCILAPIAASHFYCNFHILHVCSSCSMIYINFCGYVNISKCCFSLKAAV